MTLGVPKLITVPVGQTRWAFVTNTLPPPIANYTLTVSGLPGVDSTVSVMNGVCGQQLTQSATSSDGSFGFVTSDDPSFENFLYVLVDNNAGSGTLNVTVTITQP